MSDQLMDERLRAAGERWRAEDTAESGEAAVDLEVFVAPTRRRRWVASSAVASIAAAVVIAIIAAGAIVVARRDNTPASGGRTDFTAITGVVWHLVEVRTADGTSVPAPKVTLEFGTDGTLNADDQCNHLSGRVRARGPNLAFLQVGATLVGCTGPSLAVTNGIFSVGKTRWSRNGDKLTLSRPSIGVLIYRRLPATPLVGTSWQLTQLSGVGNERVSVPASGAGLSINSAGQFVASDGCNTLSSHATTHLDSFVLSPVYETAMGCIDPKIGAASTVIDRVLSGTVPFTIRGNELTIARPRLGLLVYTVAPPRAAVSITQLTRHMWTLRSYQATVGKVISSTTAVSLSRLAFDATGDFTVQHTCYTNLGKVTATKQTIQLTDVTLKRAVPCPSNAETAAGQRENGVVDALLTGTVTWAVHGSTLTLSKADRSLTFTD